MIRWDFRLIIMMAGETSQDAGSPNGNIIIACIIDEKFLTE